MDFRDLEYFVTIAESKNLTHASKQLFVTQPTLTKYLQKLEKELQLVLFSHVGKSMELTYAGERYLSYAREFLSLKNSLDAELADIRKLEVGRLRVGMPSFRCSYAIPEVIPLFHQHFPGVEVEIMECSSHRLDQLLMENKIDLAFYNLFEPMNGLSYEILGDDEIYAIASKDHPICEKAFLRETDSVPCIRMTDLEGETLLVQNRTQRQGEYILDELKIHDVHPKKLMESTNIRGSASLAATGYGIAFLSKNLMRHLNSKFDFAYYHVEDFTRNVRFVAARKSGTYIPVYEKDFIRLMKELG